MKIKDLIGEGEKIIKIDNNQLDIIESFFNHYNNYYKISSVEKVLSDNEVHFIVGLHGGKNGNGDWNDYLFHLNKLFDREYYEKQNIENIWLIQLINDCPDDVHDVYIGLSLKK